MFPFRKSLPKGTCNAPPESVRIFLFAPPPDELR